MTSSPSTLARATPAADDVAPGPRLSMPLVFLLSLVALAVVVVASIAVGARNLGPGTVWDALFHGGGGDAELIVRQLRVPRTVAGLLVGAALGLAGALMQALTRNPLADPGLLGVSAGAACAVVCAIA